MVEYSCYRRLPLSKFRLPLLYMHTQWPCNDFLTVAVQADKIRSILACPNGLNSVAMQYCWYCLTRRFGIIVRMIIWRETKERWPKGSSCTTCELVRKWSNWFWSNRILLLLFGGSRTPRPYSNLWRRANYSKEKKHSKCRQDSKEATNSKETKHSTCRQDSKEATNSNKKIQHEIKTKTLKDNKSE
jgi:hypothetical protein